jgi:phosphoadenosine phosphosulfate reductase
MAKTFDTPPFHVLDRAAAEPFSVSEVICYFSGGKDALCTLDLCLSRFRRVVPVFMYYIPGLSFQEEMLRYAERRYATPIIRIPHWNLPEVLKAGVLRFPGQRTDNLRKLTIADTDRYLRSHTGIHWIASGEKCIDSVERNAMIKNNGGIDAGRGRIWPIAHWSNQSVYSHLKRQQIPLPAEYKFKFAGGAKRSFGGRLWMDECVWLRDHFPEDWKKVLAMFPLAEAQIARFNLRELEKKKKAISAQKLAQHSTTSAGAPNGEEESH